MLSSTRRRALSAAFIALLPAVAFGEEKPVEWRKDVPTLKSIEGGLFASNFQWTSAATMYAYPLQSPPAAGFSPYVAVTLTDRQAQDDFQFTSTKSINRVGNPMGSDGQGNPYTFMAILDSGGQSHILSYADTVGIDLESRNRQGGFEAEVSGVGGETSYLPISDPLGVFVANATNLTVSGGQFHAPASAFRGEIHTSVLTNDDPDSALPSVIGAPMLGFYAANIRNSQTVRVVKPDGTAVRAPSVELMNHYSAPTYKYKLQLTLSDYLGASSSDPAFIPSGVNFNNFSDDPGSPTFWTFPICNVRLNPNDPFQTQPFLFDTGAQVTVLSEEVADALGFDVSTTPPQFTIDVLGVGGVTQVNGYFIPYLELPVTGGEAKFTDVPVIVLNVIDPRTGSGVIPGIIGMSLFSDRDMTLDMIRGTPDSAVYFSDPIIPQWKVNASGNWLPDANWDVGVPDGTDVPANFLGAITAARTINVDGDYTIGSMKFDNVNSYTLSGNGRLTFSSLGRPSKIEVVNGSHTVGSPLSFASPDSTAMAITVAAGASLNLSGDTASPLAQVTKLGAGDLSLRNARYRSLSINAGKIVLAATASGDDDSRIEQLTIASGGILDIKAQEVLLDYDDAQASPIQAIRQHLAAGRIISSDLTPSSPSAVAYAEASVLGLTSLDTLPITSNSLVIRVRLRGDADFSGTVDFADLLIVAQSYGNATGKVWTTGDFNYDGVSNFDDLLPLAQNYGSSAALGEGFSASFAADWALAQALTPEPGSLCALTLALAARRRRS